MDQIQKLRINAIIKRDAILAGGGILYYIFIRITGLAIPCVFRKITGWLCPGCGITRAILALADCEPAKAFAYNQYIFVAAPAVIYFVLRCDYLYIRRGRIKLNKIENIILYICLIGALVFGVLRNIIQL